MHWCPRCRGVLLSPAPVDAPARQRNYRWVARPPGRRQRDRTSAANTSAPTASTPRYAEIPRWGLRDVPPQPAPSRRRRLDVLTDRVARLVTAAAVLFLLAAAAEFGRYLILMRNRSRLIEPVVAYLSDWSVWFFSGLALVFALLSAIGLVGWLLDARRAAYARTGRRDPRGLWSLLFGCVVPVVNLVWPGVFLIELARERDDPRLLQAVRIWWAAWVINAVMAVAALFWHLATTLQAQANGVIFTVYTDLVAAATAVLSLWVMRLCEGRDLRGRLRAPKRWIATAGPAVPLIEPVRPVAADSARRDEQAARGSGEAARRAPDPALGQDDRTQDAPIAESDQEEVMAK